MGLLNPTEGCSSPPYPASCALPTVSAPGVHSLLPTCPNPYSQADPAPAGEWVHAEVLPAQALRDEHAAWAVSDLGSGVLGGFVS